MSNLLPLCLLCLVTGGLLGGCAETRPRQGGSRPPADFVEGKRLLAELRYADAARCFRRAHELEPGDEEIRRYLRRAQLLMAEDERSRPARALEREQMEDVGVTYIPGTIFPDKEHWAKVRQRHVGIHATQPEEARAEYVLEIYDVQDLLSRIPDFPGVPIRITTDTSGDGGGAGSFSFDTEEDLDCAVADPDQLETIVTNSVGEDSWDDPASIEVHKGQLIVNQTREIHWQIRDVLQALRFRRR